MTPSEAEELVANWQPPDMAVLESKARLRGQTEADWFGMKLRQEAEAALEPEPQPQPRHRRTSPRNKPFYTPHNGQCPRCNAQLTQGLYQVFGGWGSWVCARCCAQMNLWPLEEGQVWNEIAS